MSNQEFSEKIEASIQKAKAYLVNKYKLSQFDIDDITQNASIKAYKNIASFRGECSFNTWFVQIAKNCAKELFLLKEKEKLVYSDEIINDDSIAPFEDAEIYKINKRKEYNYLITKSLKELSYNHRQVIELMLNNVDSAEEIASILEIPINSVRTRFFYAKKKLQQIIKKNAHQSNIQLLNYR